MGHHNTSSTSNIASQVQIPTAVWVLLAAVVAALLAIFVFKVSVSMVVTYGFLGLMLLSHFFMHGRHDSVERIPTSPTHKLAMAPRPIKITLTSDTAIATSRKDVPRGR